MESKYDAFERAPEAASFYNLFLICFLDLKTGQIFEELKREKQRLSCFSSVFTQLIVSSGLIKSRRR